MLGGWGGGLKTAEILLAESCHEQVSVESGFKERKGRRISEIKWQRVPDKGRKKPSLFFSLSFLVFLVFLFFDKQ